MADIDDVAVTQAVCAWLGGIPGWVYDPDGTATLQPGDVLVVYGPIPEDADVAVGVRIYGGEDANDITVSVDWRAVQLRFRGAKGAPHGADLLASAANARMKKLSRTGGISGASRASLAPLGADTNGRQERSDNYEITLDNQEAS